MHLVPVSPGCPSGIWDRSDYEKLRRYDAPTADQPPRVWLCHLNEPAGQTRSTDRAPRSRICAGWPGCHDGDHLLALRVGVAFDLAPAEIAQNVVDYSSPIPLFASGSEAADHGERDLENPSPEALRAMAKLERLPHYADPDTRARAQQRPGAPRPAIRARVPAESTRTPGWVGTRGRGTATARHSGRSRNGVDGPG